MLAGVLALLQAIIITAAGAPLSDLLFGEASAQTDPSWQLDAPLAKKSCAKMEVSDPALWFDVTEDGDPDLDTVVDSYPSGVIAIVAGFQYNCVPAKTTVVAVFYSLNDSKDKPWYTSEIKLAPTDKPGTLWRGVRFKSQKPIPDGDYRVEFFVGKKLLTAGEVTVGGQEPEEPAPQEEAEQEQEEQEAEQEAEQEPEEEQRPQRRKPQRDNLVQIVGEIIDGSTQRPIPGAVFIVLQPGITAAQWADYGFPASDILTTNKADRNGRFRQSGVERNVEYSLVAWALSYTGWYMDGFVVSDNDPDPYPMYIELYR